MYTHSSRPSEKGFTLSELLVAIAILAVIGLVMLQIFMQSRTVLDHGSASVAMHHKARETMTRVTPLLMTAMVETTGATEAVLSPANPGDTADNVVFTTTEDLLAGGNFNPADVTYHTFRLRYDDQGDNTGPDPVYSNDQLLLEELASSSDFTALTDPAPRIIGRASSTDEDGIVEAAFWNIRFTREDAAGLGVRITLDLIGERRNAQRSRETTTTRLINTVQLPSFSTQK